MEEADSRFAAAEDSSVDDDVAFDRKWKDAAMSLEARVKL